MIVLTDHTANIYGVKALLNDFCKTNGLEFFIFQLKDLQNSLQNKQLLKVLDPIKKNKKILFFIVPVSIKIDQTLYDLFEGNILSFGTPATGIDHVDFDFLKKYSIPFFDAQGENKDSVVEYTLSVLPYVIDIEKMIYKEIQIGIVGFGRIGSLLGKVFNDLGFSYIVVDPFVFPNTYQKNLNQLKECDVITFHTSLTKEGPYPTFGMIDLDFLKNLNPNTILINTSRGKIFTSEAYFYAMENFVCAFDVYFFEPPKQIDLNSKKLKISTPHTAGYNWISRFRSVYRILEKFSESFHFTFQKKNRRLFSRSLRNTNF